MKLRAISPQLLVDDLAAAIAHYEQHLGFRADFVYEDFYASVSRDGAMIHLKCAPRLAGEREHRAAGEHLDAFVEVDDVHALHDDLARRGAAVVDALGTKPWGRVEFVVRDLDGYGCASRSSRRKTRRRRGRSSLFCEFEAANQEERPRFLRVQLSARSASAITFAALRPHAPITPPPGCVEAPHRKKPGSGVA